MANIMKIYKVILTVLLVTIVSPANSLGFDSLLQATGTIAAVNSESPNTDLMGSLTSKLGITETQAAGGTAALLAMANNNLSDTDSSLLSDIMPTSSSNSLTSQMLGQITDMDGVQDAFAALGLDAGMVQQFAPIILNYLTESGGSSLIGSLTKLWL